MTRARLTTSLFASLCLFLLAAKPASAGHVFLLVEENTDFSQVTNPSVMPYLNSGGVFQNPDTGGSRFCPGLVPKGALLTNYYGSVHNSAGNYMVLTTGKDQHLGPFKTVYQSDDFPKRLPDGTPNIVTALFNNSEYAASYSEDIPPLNLILSNGQALDPTPMSAAQGNYLRRHNPFTQMPQVLDELAFYVGLNSIYPIAPYPSPNYLNFISHVGYLPAIQDFNGFVNLRRQLNNPATSVPNLTMIVPNVLHDGHDAPASAADSWLGSNICGLLESPLFQPGGDGLLIVLWDESGNTGDTRTVDANGNIVSGYGGGQVAALLVGPQVVPGRYGNAYGHLNILRTVCDYLGVGQCPGDAATARPIAEVFAGYNDRTPLVQEALRLPNPVPAPPPAQSGNFTLGVASQQVLVGGTQTYYVNGAAPNAQITGQFYITPPGGGEYLYQNAAWGQTNGAGSATIGSMAYIPQFVGTLRVVLTIAGISKTVTFTCANPQSPAGFSLGVATSLVRVGGTQTYYVNGAAPNAQITGQFYITPPGGREYLYQNSVWGQTNGAGSATIGSMAYIPQFLGTLRVVLTIGGVSKTVTFSCTY